MNPESLHPNPSAKPIIRSIFEQDLYKFNMCAVILRHCPGKKVVFKFKDRRPGGKFNQQFAEAFRNQLLAMSFLRTTDKEIDFLREVCPYLPPHVLAYIRNYCYDPSQVKWKIKSGNLFVECTGPWESVMMWEVPLMALISELYFKYCDTSWRTENWEQNYRDRTWEKTLKMAHCRVAEFGLRRRHSYEVQDLVLETMKSVPNSCLIGTSNVHMAMKHGLKPIGTMAHEMIMGYSAVHGLRHANRYVMKDWFETFNGRMGVALPDTFGTDVFLRDFDHGFARIFDGVRQDSGDPDQFADKFEGHYKTLGIDPTSKSVVFSNALDVVETLRLQCKHSERFHVAFGMGTHLTNDFPECNALNIVIKMTECDGVPVVKMPDDIGKNMGDDDALRVARWTFHGTPLDVEL